MGARARECFVGRARELRWLGERAAEAHAGALRLVVVEGDAGIGKTALLRRFLSRLAGFTVLAASGDQTEVSLAYSVLTQLIAGTPTSVRGGFPLLSQVPIEHIATFAIGAQFLALLGALKSCGPVAVVVEDLQWVDRVSAKALVFTLSAAQRERAGPRHRSRGLGTGRALGPSVE